MFWIEVRAPAALDVFNVANRPTTIKFLEDVRAATQRDGVGLTINLSDVNKIRPTGALLLRAEMDRAFARQRAGSLRIVRTIDPIVNAVMCQIGVYDVAEGLGPEADREDVKHWRSATGVASDGETGGSILEAYEGRIADGLTSELYAGIVEAMTNTVHHAYEGLDGASLRRSIGKRWWLLSQERDSELSITFCDLGIGIPRSLPRSSTYSQPLVRSMWKALGIDRSDANAVRVAIELGRTSTHKEGRGRGLAEIVEAADLSTEGRVYISSNRGVFVSLGGKTHVHDHSHSVHGTLIHWTVRIEGRGASHGE